MRRQDKYPETSTFHFYNANPHNKITTDCVIRAICTALNQPWETTLKELCELAAKKGLMVDDTPCYDEYLKSKGWIKKKQPRKEDNTKYTGNDFCKELSRLNTKIDARNKERIIAHLGGHHMVAIICGKVYDTWNSTDGCIGNYWVKG